MSNSLATLSLEQLKRAVQVREQIETLTLELNRILGLSPLAYNHGGNRGSQNGHNRLNGSKRNLSPAARERIAAAQRIRWAKYNATKPQRTVTTGKNRLSAAGRAKVAAAVTARWARFRALKAKSAQAN